MAVENLLHDEIFAVLPTPPGLRLIDFLGIRFVTNGGKLGTAAFRTLYLDQRSEMQTEENKENWLQENVAALPRFQIYTHHQSVGSLNAAITSIKNLKRRTLVIENPDSVSEAEKPDEDYDSSTSAPPPARFEVVEATDTRYEVKVSAAKPVWLFLADANYPGWTATINGAAVPTFSAQILGKAVAIPKGDSTVTFRFEPASFLWGRRITMLTIGFLVFAFWRRFGFGSVSAWRPPRRGKWRKREPVLECCSA
jgi:hypothetical protein